MAARIDLRSDTVTRPTDEMRQAMAGPTSATIALATTRPSTGCRTEWPNWPAARPRCISRRGRCARRSHCTRSSGRAGWSSARRPRTSAAWSCTPAAVLSGVTFRQLAGRTGMLAPGQVAAALAARLTTSPSSTWSRSRTPIRSAAASRSRPPSPGGRQVCADAGVPLYLDGARIFNACAVTGATIAEYATSVDAMMFCLSKGLGAPIGSMLVGDADFIRDARRLKMLFGAAWRQAGIMAAAGLIALDDGPKSAARGSRECASARRGRRRAAARCIDPGVAAEPTSSSWTWRARAGRRAEWAARLEEAGLLVTITAGKVRMLTHRDVDADDIAGRSRPGGGSRKAGNEVRFRAMPVSVITAGMAQIPHWRLSLPLPDLP